VSDWFDLIEIGRLDSACTNKHFRPKFLEILPNLQLIRQEFPEIKDFVNWVFVLKGFQLPSICISVQAIEQFHIINTNKLISLTITHCHNQTHQNKIIELVNNCNNLHELCLLFNSCLKVDFFGKISFKIKSQMTKLAFHDQSPIPKDQYQILKDIGKACVNLKSFDYTTKYEIYDVRQIVEILVRNSALEIINLDLVDISNKELFKGIIENCHNLSYFTAKNVNGLNCKDIAKLLDIKSNLKYMFLTDYSKTLFVEIDNAQHTCEISCTEEINDLGLITNRLRNMSVFKLSLIISQTAYMLF
jgi:hypothetical protein